MFKTKFIVKKINNTNVVRYSKSNPSVRLHFLDIRDFIDYYEVRNIVKKKILVKFEKIHHMEKNQDVMLKQIMDTDYVFEIYKYIFVDKKYPVT